MKLTKVERVLVEGNRDRVFELMDGRAAARVDWRAYFDEISSEFSRFLPKDFLLIEERPDRVTVQTKRGTAVVKLGKKPPFGLDVAAAIAAVLAPDYEAHLFAATARDDTHSYLVRPSRWWQAFRAEHPARFRSLFLPASKVGARYVLVPGAPPLQRPPVRPAIHEGLASFLRDAERERDAWLGADLSARKSWTQDSEKLRLGKVAWLARDLTTRATMARVSSVWWGTATASDIERLRIAGLVFAMVELLHVQLSAVASRGEAVALAWMFRLFAPEPVRDRLLSAIPFDSFPTDVRAPSSFLQVLGYMGAPSASLISVFEAGREGRLSSRDAAAAWSRRLRQLGSVDPGKVFAALPVEPLLANDEKPLVGPLACWEPLRLARQKPLPRMAEETQRHYEWCASRLERVLATKLPALPKATTTTAVEMW